MSRPTAIGCWSTWEAWWTRPSLRPIKSYGRKLPDRPGNNRNRKLLGKNHVLHDDNGRLAVCRRLQQPLPLEAAPVANANTRSATSPTNSSTAIVDCVVNAVAVPFKHGFRSTTKILPGRRHLHRPCGGPRSTVNDTFVRTVDLP